MIKFFYIKNNKNVMKSSKRIGFVFIVKKKKQQKKKNAILL